MGRKVFISTLGTNNYSACHYYKGEYKSDEIRFIQEATLEYIGAKQWDKSSSALILITDLSESRNWVDDGQVEFKTKQPIIQDGLESRLKSMCLPFSVEKVKIKAGNNEEEIWDIFATVYDKIQDGDELYFDLTHGFRYLPMLVLVLGNYAKFLKNITVKSITYGNYEARVDNEAPIVDLLPLSDLQDWANAVHDFVDLGNCDKISELSKTELRGLLKESKGQNKLAKNIEKLPGLLKEYYSAISNCRNNVINDGQTVERAQLLLEQDASFIKPFEPVFDKIKEQVGQYSTKNDLYNGFVAAKWCCDKQLYQQAVTILQENIISFFCRKYNLSETNESERKLINAACYHVHYNSDEKSLISYIGEENFSKTLEICNDELLKLITSDFVTLSETIRNDYNHAGMRDNAMSAKNLQDKSIEIVIKLTDIFLKEYTYNINQSI